MYLFSVAIQLSTSPQLRSIWTNAKKTDTSLSLIPHAWYHFSHGEQEQVVEYLKGLGLHAARLHFTLCCVGFPIEQTMQCKAEGGKNVSLFWSMNEWRGGWKNETLINGATWLIYLEWKSIAKENTPVCHRAKVNSDQSHHLKKAIKQKISDHLWRRQGHNTSI